MAAEDAIPSSAGAAATAKRKAEEAAAGEESPLKMRTTKRKVDAAAAADSEKAAAAAAAAAAAETEGDEAAPEKKKTRLPPEEVDWILAREVGTSPRLFSALRIRNPDLVPSPEEEKDKKKVALYTAARVYYESRAFFADFQAQVRGQLHDKGYVETDEEAIARWAELREHSDRARKEAFKNVVLDLDED